MPFIPRAAVFVTPHNFGAQKNMTPDLLTFELNKEKDELFIHGDPVGLRRLARILEHLADVAVGGDFPHDHLFSEGWGGDQLSSEAQEADHECLNHVKIYAWPDSRGAIPHRLPAPVAGSEDEN